MTFENIYRQRKHAVTDWMNFLLNQTALSE